MVKGLAATQSRSGRRLRIDLVRERDTTLHHLGLRKVYIGDSFSRLVEPFASDGPACRNRTPLNVEYAPSPRRSS